MTYEEKSISVMLIYIICFVVWGILSVLNSTRDKKLSWFWLITPFAILLPLMFVVAAWPQTR